MHCNIVIITVYNQSSLWQKLEWLVTWNTMERIEKQLQSETAATFEGGHSQKLRKKQEVRHTLSVLS